MKKRIYFVNLWGIGDLIATLASLDQASEKQVVIISIIPIQIVRELVASIGINSEHQLKSFRSKSLVFFYLIFLTFLRKEIVFTSPLGGKSRYFANLLSKLSNRTLMAEEQGNIYEINKNLISKVLSK